MTAPVPASTQDWPRPNWHASNENASLLFFVFGTFADSSTDVARNLPAGIELTRHDHASLKSWEGYPLAGSLGAVFAEDAPETLAAARETPHVLRLGGEVADPSTLNYLRDTLETITQLLENGGIAVADPLTSNLFPPATWRRHFLGSAGMAPRQHVLIVCDQDPIDDRYQWVHTRGMRKFGRPDLSLTDTPEADINHAGALCGQLVDMLAMGGHFAEGQLLPVDGLAGPLIAHLDANPDDPRFYNTHVALRWPQ